MLAKKSLKFSIYLSVYVYIYTCISKSDRMDLYVDIHTDKRVNRYYYLNTCNDYLTCLNTIRRHYLYTKAISQYVAYIFFLRLLSVIKSLSLLCLTSMSKYVLQIVLQYTSQCLTPNTDHQHRRRAHV